MAKAWRLVWHQDSWFMSTVAGIDEKFLNDGNGVCVSGRKDIWEGYKLQAGIPIATDLSFCFSCEILNKACFGFKSFVFLYVLCLFSYLCLPTSTFCLKGSAWVSLPPLLAASQLESRPFSTALQNDPSDCWLVPVASRNVQQAKERLHSWDLCVSFKWCQRRLGLAAWSTPVWTWPGSQGLELTSSVGDNDPYLDFKMLHSVCQQICKTQQWPQD